MQSLVDALVLNFLRVQAKRDLDRRYRRRLARPQAVIGDGSWRTEERIPSQLAIALLTGYTKGGEA